jgi:phage tail-like protein
MTTQREVPYGAFNFIINFDGADAGGFSEVSGLGSEISVAEYRNGNDPENHVLKIPGTHTVSDVTLKRGIINSADLFGWINETRTQGPSGKRTVTITLQNEAHEDVQKWTLSGVIPMTYTGPTFTAAGGGDVAMEELVLSCEGFVIEVP